MGHSSKSFELKLFLNLIRALFPRWSFFEKVAYNFEIQFKIPNSSHWEPLTFEAKPSFMAFFLNADCNLALAQVNIIEHFSQDVLELQSKEVTISSKEVQHLTSFRLLRSVLRTKLNKYELDSPTIQ